MASTHRENEETIQVFNQAQQSINQPAILTVDCAKIRDAALRKTARYCAAALERINANEMVCMAKAQIDSATRTTNCALYGGCTEDDLAAITADLETAQKKCTDTATEFRNAVNNVLTRSTASAQRLYKECCTNNPGSCNADASSTQA